MDEDKSKNHSEFDKAFKFDLKKFLFQSQLSLSGFIFKHNFLIFYCQCHFRKTIFYFDSLLFDKGLNKMICLE